MVVVCEECGYEHVVWWDASAVGALVIMSRIGLCLWNAKEYLFAEDDAIRLNPYSCEARYDL